MEQTIVLNYQLKNSDYIEAEQLKLIKSRSAWLFLLNVLVFIFWGIADLKQVTEQDLFILDYLKDLFVSNEMPTNHIISALYYFTLALILSSNTFPKYNPLYRWVLNKKYQKNFVKQEILNLAIDEQKIAIASSNYRSSRQWQDFTRFRENKYIFLLDASRNICNSKRIR